MTLINRRARTITWRYPDLASALERFTVTHAFGVMLDYMLDHDQSGVPFVALGTPAATQY